MTQRLEPQLFDDVETRLRRMCVLLPRALHLNGAAIVNAHPRAIQYLEAAPVLAAALPVADPKRQCAVDAMVEIAIGGLCEAGAPLKDVMRAVGVAPPLRRLSALNLPKVTPDLVMALSGIDARRLGNMVPAGLVDQRVWLGWCAYWRRHMIRRRRPANLGFAWAAERMAAEVNGARPVGDATALADLLIAEPEGFSEAWTWARARQAAQAWHVRLREEASLAAAGMRVGTLLDRGGHPDVLQIAGLTFVALRTPSQLVEEGAEMRHCVASYMEDVARGSCHIVSVRLGGRRIATLELSRRWTVNQLKGPCNAPVALEVRAAVREYRDRLMAEAAASAGRPRL